jgi:hypothetical protein
MIDQGENGELSFADSQQSRRLLIKDQRLCLFALNDVVATAEKNTSSRLSGPKWRSPKKAPVRPEKYTPTALAFSTFFDDGAARASNRPIMHGWIA